MYYSRQKTNIQELKKKRSDTVNRYTHFWIKELKTMLKSARLSFILASLHLLFFLSCLNPLFPPLETLQFGTPKVKCRRHIHISCEKRPLASPCPSVRTYQHGSHWTNSTWDQMLVTCMKVYPEHPNFVKKKKGQKYRATSMKTAGCCTVAKSLLHNAQYSYIAITCSSTLHTESIVAFPMRQCLRDALQCHISTDKLPVLLALVLTFCFVTMPTTRHLFSCNGAGGFEFYCDS